MDKKSMQWMLGIKIKVFHEIISCSMKSPWNCIPWNALKKNSQCISVSFFLNCSWPFFSSLLFQINKTRCFFIFHESWRKSVKSNLKSNPWMLPENRKVKIKGSKLLYKPKWTVMIARFGGLPILTVSRVVITNIISFSINSKPR